ncbi:MAG: signal peptidase, partial [Flaviaesturariibacter sp.]|nr:signal peptidase [Flaviaesturariibacter sp.]
MRSFFKMFFASFLALIVFMVIGFFLFIALVSSLASLAKDDKADIAAHSVLTIDLSRHYAEQEQNAPLRSIAGGENAPGLYDLVRLIRHAKTDKDIAGIYLVANSNANGLASSEEIRRALVDFKTSNKFIIAHGDVVSQSAYYVASAADKIYASPTGTLEWKGLAVELAFFKGTLDRLKIQPQIFYAGKFKSATEPFRADRMTPENRLQTAALLGSIYSEYLQTISAARGIDTATLHALANTGAIQQAPDAVQHRLLDAVKYDDEVRDEMKKRLSLGKYDKLPLATLDDYAKAGHFRETGSGRIAVIFAEGSIVDGSDRQSIASEDYIRTIRKARLDKSVKAIVLRINSGGGSALASENIWRELSLAKADKPLVVSFGDVAASGGYYIATAADTIFALPNTITGSIGVFGIIPNMSGFFSEKLGVTFDAVSTADLADGPTITRPMTETEKTFAQQGVDRIYLQFKQRVAQGRKKDIATIDSIAQGRVWSGTDALRIGLVDRMGTLRDAIACAARMAKLESFRLREYPESGSWLDDLFNRSTKTPEAALKSQLGADNYEVYRQM